MLSSQVTQSEVGQLLAQAWNCKSCDCAEPLRCHLLWQSQQRASWKKRRARQCVRLVSLLLGAVACSEHVLRKSAESIISGIIFPNFCYIKWSFALRFFFVLQDGQHLKNCTSLLIILQFWKGKMSNLSQSSPDWCKIKSHTPVLFTSQRHNCKTNDANFRWRTSKHLHNYLHAVVH